MVETANFKLPHVQVAQSGREESINETFVALDSLLAGVVKDVALTAPPGVASEGHMWAVPAGATGLWAGQDGNLAIYLGGGWVFKTPPASMSFYDETTSLEYNSTGAGWSEAVAGIPDAPIDGTAYARQDGAWVVVSVTGGASDFGFSYGGSPTASEVVGFITLARATTCPANFAGSAGNVGVNPTASFSIDVQANAVSIGTITIATDGSFTFATTGGVQQVIAAGSKITFVAPAGADATIADIALTLIGNV